MCSSRKDKSVLVGKISVKNVFFSNWGRNHTACTIFQGETVLLQFQLKGQQYTNPRKG